MRGTMSNKPCEAPRIMWIRSTSQLSRRSANLGLDMVKPRLCEVESVYEISTYEIISKRRYGMKIEGNLVSRTDKIKGTLVVRMPLAKRV